MGLEQIQIYVDTIKEHVEKNLIHEDSDIIGNLTISLTLTEDGKIHANPSVIGDIVPKAFAYRCLEIIQEALDRVGSGVRVLPGKEDQN